MFLNALNVFALVVIIGLLSLLTSFISLDTHISKESNIGLDNRNIKLPARERKVEHTLFDQSLENLINKFRSTSKKSDRPSQTHTEQDKHGEEVDKADDEEREQKLFDAALAEIPKKVVYKNAQSYAGDDDNEESTTTKGTTSSSTTTKKCVLKFKDKCKMNPIVKYWDESTDCYISPLKGVSGLSAPVEDRKYIVFQADLGGWNNIRMGLEVVILFAQVTGRILVLPPQAVLYLLHFNKKWKDNKSGMEDYFDFERLKMGNGLEVISMQEFLTTVAAPGLLALPLPKNDTTLSKQPLYDYLEKACYLRQWSPGKIFIGFNLTSLTNEQDLLTHNSFNTHHKRTAKGKHSSTTSTGSTYGGDDDETEGEGGGIGNSKDSAGDTVISPYGVSADDDDDDESEGENEVEEGNEEEGEHAPEKSNRRRSLQASTSSEQKQQLESRIKALFGTVNESQTPDNVERITQFAIGRQAVTYDYSFHQHRAIYFPGHHENRLLTHFYSYLYFATPKEEHRAKRYIRDRLRYHDQIFCTSSIFIKKLMMLEDYLATKVDPTSGTGNTGHTNQYDSDSVIQNIIQFSESNYVNHTGQHPLESTTLTAFNKVPFFGTKKTETTGTTAEALYTLSESREPGYIAFHIRRGDFQQKHTRLEAETIVEYTNHLVPDRAKRVAYIATDEGNRTFFEPFFREYKAVYFLKDLQENTNIEAINQNYIGMIEQVICANAHTFIGTPLSTFTAYITRMRGYMNRTLTAIPEPILPTENSLVKLKPQSTATTGKFYSGGRYNKVAENRIPASTVNREGIYSRTYYFMKHHMHQLHTKPHTNFPLWIRDFVEAFYAIDDDSV